MGRFVGDGSGVSMLDWMIGEVSITRVEESLLPVPATALMPDYTPAHLEPLRDWAGPYFRDDERLWLSVHTFVVVSESTIIVVDTCVGAAAERPLPTDPTFPDRLGAAVDGGLEAVDLVLCTHLHFDHVGWNTREIDGQLVPTFPNARYLFGRTELDHLAVDDHMAIRDPSVQPVLDAGLVDVVETDHRLTSEVRLIPTPGHTPGHVSVLIESAGERALITGDAVHNPLQLAVPDLAAANFDWDSAMSSQTRRDLVDAHAEQPTLVLGTHFAPPTAGHIRRADDRVWFES